MRRAKTRFSVAVLGVLALLTASSIQEGRQVDSVAAAPVFKLPWQAGQRMFVLQGPNQGSHTGFSSKYAYDFATDPIRGASFVVRATRAGKVAKVVQQFPNSPDCDPSYNLQANYLLLDHGDGLGTLYLHLAQNSVVPKAGALVNQGDPLALAGHTGYICGPSHLHYTVLDIKTWKSLDFPFADATVQQDGGRPRVGRWYVSENGLKLYSSSLPFVPRRAGNGVQR